MAKRTYKNTTKLTLLRTAKHTNTIVLKLVPFYVLTKLQIKLFSEITNNINIMKHIGVGKLWSQDNIITFIKDELQETKKTLANRRYFSYILLKNNSPIGFIAGRKHERLLSLSPLNISKYDLLLRMFITSSQSGKGYGTLLIKKFIDIYTKLLKKVHATLYSDIHPDNNASIKIHTNNAFTYIGMVKYPNGIEYRRYSRMC